MDVKRLEELAGRATSESKYFTYRGPCTEQDLRDLARCAAAWAELERMLTAGINIELAKCWGGEIRIRMNDVKTTLWGNTAIEAVEAAKEAKP
jgi:hypothetical protein